MTVALELWKALLGHVGCVVCTRGFAGGEGRAEQHHVAQGSGKRSEWARAVLCWGHHQGGAGLHGMGGKAFCRLYRPPGDDEFGLVVWTIEDAFKVLYGLLKRLDVLAALGVGHKRKKTPSDP